MTIAALVQVHLPYFSQLPQDTLCLSIISLAGQMHHHSALWQFLRKKGIQWQLWNMSAFVVLHWESCFSNRCQVYTQHDFCCLHKMTDTWRSCHSTYLPDWNSQPCCGTHPALRDPPLYPGGFRCLIHSVLEKEIKNLIRLHSFENCTRCRLLCLKEYPEPRVVFLICAKFLVTVKIDEKNLQQGMWLANSHKNKADSLWLYPLGWFSF